MANEADRLMEAILVALVGAFRNPRRVDLQENGMDERDLAFEANLLDPPDVETARYIGHRRRGVLRTYRHMEGIGLLRLVDHKGIFSVFPTETAGIHYEYLLKPFWEKWLLRLRKANPDALSSLPRISAQ